MSYKKRLCGFSIISTPAFYPSVNLENVSENAALHVLVIRREITKMQKDKR